MTVPELLLPKLSPGKLLAPSVRHAMFIDLFALTTTPVTEDLLFLTDNLYQDAPPNRRDSIRLRNGEKNYFHRWLRNLSGVPSRMCHRCHNR